MVFQRVAIAILLGLAASAPAIAQHAHATPNANAASQTRFHADQPLSREMAGIRQAFVAQHAAIRDGRLDAAGYAALGQEVETRVNTMIRECRLPAEADRVLHGYIGRMSTAAARLRRADAGPIAHRAAAMEVIDAYNEYGSHFTDPTWKALTP